MSVHRTAAARRARLRELLRSRTQAEALFSDNDMQRYLADTELSLRTLYRDLQAIRKCPRATHPRRSALTNESQSRLNRHMTKAMKKIEERLAVIEDAQLRIVKLLEQIPTLSEYVRLLMTITSQAEADRRLDRAELKGLRDEFCSAPRAEQSDSEYIHH